MKGDRIVQSIVALASLIVMGHHTGLSNLTQLQDKLTHAPQELKEIGSRVKEEQQKALVILNNAYDIINSPDFSPNAQFHQWWYLSTLTRFCFSAVIDADRLDAERYFNPQRSEMRQYRPPSVNTLIKRLQTYMYDLGQKDNSDSTLNKMRQYIYKKATQSASQKETFFTLHAPTGSGKTLASLSFALHHANRFKKNRIIFALPLTSVTEQTSKIYSDILGKNNVIEHHSQVQIDDKSEKMNKLHLAVENWDRPCIVTTTVQLFESLFSNLPSKTRKLHRIANSVIVLDEYQKLPLHVLRPILSMLKILREKFNITVLFMSATPLALEQSKVLHDVGRPIEIVKDFKRIFIDMQHVNYKLVEQPLSDVALIEKMKNYPSILCIVNTRKDAQRIYRRLRDEKKYWDKTYHLSTTMCSHHRFEIIEQIKQAQEANKKIAVISTSLLEVGVDLDFFTVFRAFAPLDSIIQAAGRCNRERREERGIVYLFDLIKSENLEGFYEQSIIQTKQFLKQVGISALHDPSKCITYFRKIYSNAGEDGLDKYEIDKMLFEYQRVATDFKMIVDENTESVLCTKYKGFSLKKFNSDSSLRTWYREMQPFIIQISKQIVKSKKMPEVNGLYIWDGSYDTEIGYEL